ncbi:MAG: hypothetical protein EBR28_10785, partial [Planctomycetia bacterium]|nr:hypothetical protein [Planctomycetia bacterium]
MADLAVAGWTSGPEPESKSDRYLAKRLAAASADYKGVALTTFLLGAAVAGGLWLAIGVVAEHWLVPGGLAPAVRWAWLGVALVALTASAVRWLLPLVRYRVNLVYAARAIEREHPELHNDLVNTVLVKAHPDANPEKVVRSLERRTAKRLAEVPVEAVIDRTTPLRLAYVLATLVALAGLYELTAPKSLLVTAGRLFLPWAGLAAPSRVHIAPPRLAWRVPGEENAAADVLDRRRIEIDAGTATLVRGRQLVVASDIRGLRSGEKPLVVVAPLKADGSVDAALPAWDAELTRSPAAAGAQRMFAAVLPDSARGLDQSVEITIAAGDARSGPLRVAVVDSPALLVREIRYVFPPYTRLAPESVAWQGDIRAVEGTEATIVAESNKPLDDAWIDFGGDGSRDLRFTRSAADLARVTKSFRLQLNAEGTGPEHTSYRLLFQPRSADAGARDQVVVDPLEHRIEVVADAAPEVAIEEPRESPLRVPPAAPVTVRVQAHDPDFALARVVIETRLQGGASGPEVVLLEQERSTAFRGAAQLVPERLGAGAGAVLEYRAVAVDNKPKRPNVSHSPWQALRIDPTAPPRQPEPPPPGRRSEDDGRQDSRQRQDGRQEQPGNGRTQTGDQPDQPAENAQGEKEKKDGDKTEGGTNDRTKAQEQEKPQGQGKPKEQGKPQEQGQQDGQAQGGESGAAQQQPSAAKQAGDQQGQGQNQGQGAEQGQGVGAQGERQGGREQQGRQQGGAERQGGQQSEAGQAGDQTNARGAERGQPPGAGRGRQGGGDQGQGRSARDSAVAADGTNDGEAMERILEHRREAGDGVHEHAPECAGADGQPCGKDGCPSCKGQGAGGQSGGGEGQAGGERSEKGGGEGAAGGQSGGQAAAGKSSEGVGKQGEGAGKQGEGAGKQGEGAGKQGEGA